MCCAVLSRSVVSNSLPHPVACSPPASSVLGDSPGKNTGVGCYALLQGLFPTQGLNPDLPHWRQILYHLSHQGSPEILQWLAYPFSRGSSWSRNWTGGLCIAGGFFLSYATREAQNKTCKFIYFWSLVKPIKNPKNFPPPPLLTIQQV